MTGHRGEKACEWSVIQAAVFGELAREKNGQLARSGGQFGGGSWLQLSAIAACVSPHGGGLKDEKKDRKMERWTTSKRAKRHESERVGPIGPHGRADTQVPHHELRHYEVW